MSNVILNGLSSALYRGIELLGASADLAQRLRGHRPSADVTWR